jgi:SAM-dependent methyltransferase
VTTTAQTFTKYGDLGDYHWQGTYLGPWRRSSPYGRARYALVARMLGRRIDLARARGADLGCGDGVMLHTLGLRGARVVGVDFAADGLAVARHHIRALGGRDPWLARGDCQSLPLRSGSLDYVASVEMIEHLEDDRGFVGETARVLRDGGHLVVTTPNRRPDGSLHDPFHVREYDAGELRALLETSFREVEVLGQFPRGLARLYFGATGIRLVDLAVRVGFMVLASLGWNPFARLVTRQPGTGWDGLVAVCRK